MHDDNFVRQQLTRPLEKAGWHVRTFASGAELLAGLASGQPGCLLLDVSMPGMSDLELQTELLLGASDAGRLPHTGRHHPDVRRRPSCRRGHVSGKTCCQPGCRPGRHAGAESRPRAAAHRGLRCPLAATRGADAARAGRSWNRWSTAYPTRKLHASSASVSARWNITARISWRSCPPTP